MPGTWSLHLATTLKSCYRARVKLLFFPLIAVGFAANWLELPLLVNASFHSGSIFALLAVYLLGTPRGTVAAAAIASCTCVIWQHPYALIVMTAEATVVGQLVQRRKMGLIQADTIFWVAVGMPLTYLFCNLALKSPPGPSYYFATKLAVNAIANAMVARLILTCQGLWSGRSLTPLREAVFNLLALFVFCPVFAFFVLSSRRDFSEAGNYSGKFTLLLLILLGSLAMAEILSKRVVAVLDQFNDLTDELPRRLMADGVPIVWPKNRVQEADHLINNFRHIAESLTPLYLQINQLNETLEERIAARTQELVKSQALTIDVVDSLRSSISVLDEHGVIIVVNEPWRRFARENEGADSSYLGTNYLEVCRSSMWRSGSLPAASAFLGIRAVLEGERDHFEMEYACELPGETRWYQMIASKLTGSRLGAVVSHSDITGRKLAEEAVQASEMKHRLLFDSAGDGIFIVDRQSRILAANPLACHRLGYYDTELNQLSFGQIQSPDQGQLLADRMDRLFQQGHLLYETVMMHKDGSPVPTEVNARGTFWNKEPAMMAICRDLTERKRAEEDLGEARQFIEQVISCAQEGIVVCDLDLRYRGWNPYMEKLTGLPAGEVLGRHPAELFPEHVKAGLLEHLEAARCGAAKNDFDMVSVTATGEQYWTSSLSSQLLNTRGEVAGVIMTVREITWRKQMEDEIRQALESAEAANAGMQRLLRTVSHEFRTPLGLLTGCTDILDRHWDKLKPDQRRLQTGYIRNAASQLTVLVDSVTAFNLAQAEQPSRAQRFDIGALCARIAADASAVWQAGHTFEVSIAPNCGTGQIDDSLLRRVLENLLSNAFRYTPPKGTVTLQVRRTENRLHLAVSDTGIGISEQDQKHIFDQFYRGQNVDDRRGLGLGLAIVQEALAKLEGSIEITSCVHEGSAMRVAIPISE